MLLPQALMGVATVALVYDLTRRRFGLVVDGISVGPRLPAVLVTLDRGEELVVQVELANAQLV